jgi:8-oxo-dGTP pyrophosphatase MutT (NUDIX family)
MAGILPVAYHNNNIYFLLGRETVDVEHRSKGQWSDFGGGFENGESAKETAIREGFEETGGLFGDTKDIEYLIDNSLIKKFKVNKYTTYVIQVPYTKDLPKTHREMYLDVLKNKKHLITEHNGLYEKDIIKWVKLENLNKVKKIRPWYKYMIKTVYNHFNKKV